MGKDIISYFKESWYSTKKTKEWSGQEQKNFELTEIIKAKGDDTRQVCILTLV